MKDEIGSFILVQDWRREFTGLLAGRKVKQLGRQKDGALLFAGFVNIVMAASKCPIPGVLLDFDGIIGPNELAADTGFDAEVFEDAIHALCGSHDLSLLEEHTITIESGAFQFAADFDPQLAAHIRRTLLGSPRP